MENNTNIFSKRVKELRESLGMSQADFAKSVNTSQTTLSSYENTDKTPSLDIVKEIALKYHISLDWLFGLSDSKSIDSLPQTMGDILRMLFAIQKSTYLDIYNHTENVDVSTDPSYNQYEQLYLHEIGFINHRLNTYIKEWYKMLSLYLDGTIDEEVYSLWMEKTLRKADNYSSFDQSLTESPTTE